MIAEQYKVDSCQINIPIRLFKKLPSDYEYSITFGDVTSELRRKSKTRAKYYDDGTFRISIEEYNNGRTHNVVFKATSKILGSNYFNGLSRDKSIKELHKFLNSLGFIISFDNFYLRSTVTNVDVCRDYIVHEVKSYDDIPLYIEKVRRSVETTSHYSKINTKSSIISNSLLVGNKDIPSLQTPFVKIYNKGLELNTKSKAFKEVYLQEALTNQVASLGGVSPLSLYRYEVSFKSGANVKGVLGNRKNTLANLVECNQDTLSDRMKKVAEEYAMTKHLFEMGKVKVKESKVVAKKLSNKDFMIVHCFIGLVERDGNYKGVFSYIRKLLNELKKEGKSRQYIGAVERQYDNLIKSYVDPIYKAKNQ